MSTMLSSPRLRRGVIAWISGLLVTTAVIYFGYQLWMGLGSDDIGRLETPLVLSIASQIEKGPRTLYGPYTERNPLVLIHAPLYYRLAALLALPLASLGADSVVASLAIGRLISLTATLGCFVLAYRMSVLDGMARRAGVWAVCLIAAAPIPGILTVMVRPDSLAVALQMLGVLLVLRNLQEEVPRPEQLVVAYAAFALALCTKQHNVVALAVSSSLLTTIFALRRVRLWSLLIAHIAGLAIVVAYLGFEEIMTGQMMSRSVFVLPCGPFRRINYASWAHVGEVFQTIFKKTFGLIALAASCLGYLRVKRSSFSLDSFLLILLAAELLALVPLCLFNRGAADNYALQATILACILIGRSLSRALDDMGAPALRPILIVIATMVLLARDLQFVELSARCWREERAILRSMFASRILAHRSPEERYFVDLPQYNRLFGRVDLAHDEWLYGAFEAVGAAEPRSRWLRSALANGPVHQVIVPSPEEKVPGLEESLTNIGYINITQFGQYRVWERR